MAYPNFEAWLVDFLQKSCGFSPEDANEIKDEILKNIKWYNQQDEKDHEKKLLEALEEIKKKVPNPYAPITSPPPIKGNPWIGKPMWPVDTPYVGDPLPGQEPRTGDPLPDNNWTLSNNYWENKGKRYYSKWKNENLSERKDDSSDH